MRTIYVEPDRLEMAAGKVEQSVSDYNQTYHAIYNAVDKMALSWAGKDNTAFTEQIKSYEDDLKQISIIMSQYAAFLRNCAKAYRETQEENFAQANRLKRS